VKQDFFLASLEFGTRNLTSEKGINEKEQMERLLKENIELKDELGKLNREIYELECRLGINPF